MVHASPHVAPSEQVGPPFGMPGQTLHDGPHAFGSKMVEHIPLQTR